MLPLARSLFAVSIVALATPSAPSLAATSLAAALSAPRGKVVETSHRRDVTLHPHWAVVTDTHEFAVARGEKGALTAVYELALPRSAAIVGLKASAKSIRGEASAIDAEAAVRTVPRPSAGEADLALLRETAGSEDLASYQLVLHPVSAARPITVEIEWVMPTELNSSLVSATLPTRGDNPMLKGTALFASAASGATGKLSELRVNGVKAARGETSFDQTAASVTLEARLEVSGRGTRLDYHATGLGGNLWALTMAAASPSVGGSRERFANVVIIVDVSRSMTDAGLDAARVVVEQALESAGDAHVEVVTFAREARGLLGGLTRGAPATRARIKKALAEVKLANGSNLRGAIHLASGLLTGKEARARAQGSASARRSAILVVSDGQLPLTTDADQLREAAGDVVAGEGIVFTVDVAPRHAALPTPPGGPLRGLILETGGRAFSLYASAATESARRIVKELAPAPQLGELELELDGEKLESLELPAHLAAGSGFVRTTLWVGARPPRSVTLRGVRGGKPEVARARAGGKKDRRLAAALALRDASAASLDDVIEATKVALVDRAGVPTTFERAIASAGTAVPVVTPLLSLVIPDPTSRFARERLAFAKKWGTELYRRAPSEDEGELLRRSPAVHLSAGPSRPTRLRRLVRNGGLDRSTLGRTIRTQLFRPVRHCYERSLRHDRKLAGTVRVRFEIARSEVVDAIVTSAGGLPDVLRACVLDAAFELNVPEAAEDGDTTYVVNYPFRLRPSKKGGTVDRGAGEIDTDTGDPLENL